MKGCRGAGVRGVEEEVADIMEVATTAQVISSLGARLTRRGQARSREKISLGEMAEAGAMDRMPRMAIAADAGVCWDHAATLLATHCRGSEGNG
jgi:hypothetical protein